MIDDIRAENMALLAKELHSVSALADLLGKSESQVSQWINRSINSGTGKPRAMRSSTARQIEHHAGKPAGWLDIDHGISENTIYPNCNTQKSSFNVESNVFAYSTWPFKSIDIARFYALPDHDRSAIEHLVRAMISEAETRNEKRSESRGR